jgi:hypothetical protein
MNSSCSIRINLLMRVASLTRKVATLRSQPNIPVSAKQEVGIRRTTLRSSIFIKSLPNLCRSALTHCLQCSRNFFYSPYFPPPELHCLPAKLDVLREKGGGNKKKMSRCFVRGTNLFGAGKIIDEKIRLDSS